MSKEGGGGVEKISSTSGKGGRGSPILPSQEEQPRQGRSPIPKLAPRQSAVSRTAEETATGGTSREALPHVPATSALGPVPSTEVAPRQVIAVSVSKGPSAFFNLARKFLVTDEMCDLSALEGAIVSAVDAAHLLERSKIATIIRVQTSYVTVEPKRRRQAKPTETVSTPIDDRLQAQHLDVPSVQPLVPAVTETTITSRQPMEITGRENLPPPDTFAHSTERSMTRIKKSQQKGKGMSGALRRARIIITVKRTEDYKTWLQENPLQAHATDEAEETGAR
uniref:DNA/RNA-binding protein Alba-like domain-containing protein n=1 Tax=Helicotheca tamesis TaxID=374047 RepID=A0A7S2MJT3_9STRA|mmetsp:Transcript_1719/g.2505  ORF Transcript_1719/g.2505 Transcript_1719/m.2505 type:complete len:280 (+) Transcript_1719:318-1157(+)|eukprot:CAMPEP_0185740828 /NCGR_PEP_ID=MMETSP1171-20130828/38630_1 /TAXON_ID=374046 /ORGANISM="Helicotheca tamensis, Strain CCMP826" /LENGTH=279 /DNA_ID=CAMNT_0028412755 /DNA_START=309 /DNA_END=1148 /DNA_ORIENTATION=+